MAKSNILVYILFCEEIYSKIVIKLANLGNGRSKGLCYKDKH